MLVAPLVNYIWTLHQQRPDLTLTVAVPEIVVRHWWHRILHDRIAWRLRRALQPLPSVVVTSVPFHLAVAGLSLLFASCHYRWRMIAVPGRLIRHAMLWLVNACRSAAGPSGSLTVKAGRLG